MKLSGKWPKKVKKKKKKRMVNMLFNKINKEYIKQNLVLFLLKLKNVFTNRTEYILFALSFLEIQTHSFNPQN